MDLSKLPKLSNTAQATAPPSPASQTAAPGTAFCTQCGQALEAGMRFCGHCGAPTPAQDRPQAVLDYEGQMAPPLSAVDAWVSAILGLAFMLLGGSFARFLLAKLSGQPFHTGVNWTSGPQAGTEVAYFELDGYTAWSDSALFLFGVALVLEAAVLLIAGKPTHRKRGLVLVALSITALATLYNLGIAGLLLSAGIPPLLSLVCVAVGGAMIAYEWQSLRQIRPAEEP